MKPNAERHYAIAKAAWYSSWLFLVLNVVLVSNKVDYALFYLYIFIILQMIGLFYSYKVSRFKFGTKYANKHIILYFLLIPVFGIGFFVQLYTLTEYKRTKVDSID